MMYRQNELSEDSIPVGYNIPLTFKKVTRKQGGYGDKRWTSLDFIFLYQDPTTREEKWFVHKAFQPAADKYFAKRDYAIFLSEILDSLAGEPLWKTIRGCRSSWDEFYTEYIKLTDGFRDKKIFIKTGACPYFRNKEKWIACFTSKNFISTKPDLEYTYLEFNEVEEFLEEGEKENLKAHFNIKSVNHKSVDVSISNSVLDSRDMRKAGEKMKNSIDF